MIDWIAKLPDGVIGIALAVATWFGFNYAVLAERAMELEIVAPARESCLAQLGQAEANARPIPSGIGELLGMPALDELEARVIQNNMPRILSEAEKLARCGCAAAASPLLRWDFAVHTASFRIIPAAEAASFRKRMAGALTDCSKER